MIDTITQTYLQHRIEQRERAWDAWRDSRYHNMTAFDQYIAAMQEIIRCRAALR